MDAINRVLVFIKADLNVCLIGEEPLILYDA
jgi:hypothetical protein